MGWEGGGRAAGRRCLCGAGAEGAGRRKREGRTRGFSAGEEEGSQEEERLGGREKRTEVAQATVMVEETAAWRAGLPQGPPLGIRVRPASRGRRDGPLARPKPHCPLARAGQEPEPLAQPSPGAPAPTFSTSCPQPRLPRGCTVSKRRPPVSQSSVEALWQPQWPPSASGRMP